MSRLSVSYKSARLRLTAKKGWSIIRAERKVFLMKTIVAISREYGSGGRIVAQRLAKKLGVPFYDKEIIEAVAKETGFAENFVRDAESRPSTSFMYSLCFSAQTLSPADQVFIAQAGIIKKLADEGGCVIVGRCADFILRERAELLRVFVHAPMDERVRRAGEEYGVQEKNIEGFINKQDKRRASYYDYFTNARWGDSHAHDLCVSTSLGIDTVVDMICTAAKSCEEALS